MQGALEPIKIVQGKRARQLSRAVRPEIEEDDTVPVTDLSNRLFIGVDDGARLNELVSDTRFV